MDWLLGLLWVCFLNYLRKRLNDYCTNLSKSGYVYKRQQMVPIERYDLEFISYPTDSWGGVNYILYPLIEVDGSLTWRYVPILFVYDWEFMSVLMLLHVESEIEDYWTAGFFFTLLRWCLEGSHGLCTPESFNLLICAARQIFSPKSIEFGLKWSHAYLLFIYGNDYHTIIPTYEQNKMAYFAFCFIEMFEKPFLE